MLDRTQADCERRDPPSRHGLEQHGIPESQHCLLESGHGAACGARHPAPGRPARQPAARSWSAPASSPAVRPKTSSSCATKSPMPTVKWGDVNQPISEAQFDRLYAKMLAFWQGHDVYVQDCFVGADPGLRAAHPRDQPAGLAQPLRAPACSSGPIRARPTITCREFTIHVRARISRPTRPRTAPTRRPASSSISRSAWC